MFLTSVNLFNYLTTSLPKWPVAAVIVYFILLPRNLFYICLFFVFTVFCLLFRGFFNQNRVDHVLQADLA